MVRPLSGRRNAFGASDQFTLKYRLQMFVLCTYKCSERLFDENSNFFDSKSSFRQRFFIQNELSDELFRHFASKYRLQMFILRTYTCSKRILGVDLVSILVTFQNRNVHSVYVYVLETTFRCRFGSLLRLEMFILCMYTCSKRLLGVHFEHFWRSSGSP